jgi:hypothetical protein
MSINYQSNGTVLFISDANPAVTQLETGKTPAQLQADYVTFQNTWPLAWWQANWQSQLDALLDNNFDLRAFIRAGTSTTVTATNIGTFLATINNNYRTLRAQIVAASTAAAVQAININSGWPSNP